MSSGKYLGGGTATADENGGLAGDITLGRVLGNGGDWFEVVITAPNLDLTGWTFEMYSDGALESTLTLTDNSLWTQLLPGTILTISEDQPEDVSYDPQNGDWWVNVRADTNASGVYITASSFAVNNDDWRLVVKDAEGTIRYGPSGEGIGGSGGINSEEIFKLEENPSAFILPGSSCYDDSESYSTFGKPNLWSSGTKVQDFTPLRTGGAPTSQCDETDLRAVAFDPDRLIEINISMAPEDFDSLRREQRSLMGTFGGQCGEAPAPSPYNFYEADVTIDGSTLFMVGIRKKGFFGSVSRVKPSFKIDFFEFGGESSVYGLDRMTLNNLQQDPSLLDQCLGYDLHRLADLSAPLCNFSHVTVNDVSYGIYAHVESIKAPFLKANYGDSTGNLYEGSSADFRENWIAVIEKKNNEDSTDLEAIKTALEIEDDAAALAALGAVVDLDQFIRAWAMAGLIGDWDSYVGNANNWWMYENKISQRYEFIPWSMDDIFGRDNPLTGGGSVARTYFDNAAITNRLWKISEIREAYRTQILDLKNTVWDETALLNEIDRMNALISPVAGPRTAAVNDTRNWILGRATQVEADFANGTPTASSTLPPKNCLEIEGSITADFTTTYTDPMPQGVVPGSTFTVNNFSFSDSAPLQGIGSLFGPSAEFGTDMYALRLIGLAEIPAGYILNITINGEDIAANTPEPIPTRDSIASQLLFLNIDPLFFFPVGAVVNTEVDFTSVGLNPGDPVTGSVTADLAAWVAAPEPSAGLSLGTAVLALAYLARKRRKP
ncbi:MAG: CotH kinase family protein [Myxococcota bacterium]|nr:CotH kinase family protein [Myxococcota bacterium]